MIIKDLKRFNKLKKELYRLSEKNKKGWVRIHSEMHILKQKYKLLFKRERGGGYVTAEYIDIKYILKRIKSISKASYWKTKNWYHEKMMKYYTKQAIKEAGGHSVGGTKAWDKYCEHSNKIHKGYDFGTIFTFFRN